MWLRMLILALALLGFVSATADPSRAVTVSAERDQILLGETADIEIILDPEGEALFEFTLIFDVSSRTQLDNNSITSLPLPVGCATSERGPDASDFATFTVVVHCDEQPILDEQAVLSANVTGRKVGGELFLDMVAVDRGTLRTGLLLRVFVPEPTSVALLATSLLGLAALRRRASLRRSTL